MNATEIVGYGMDGDVYCVRCLKSAYPQTLTCKCEKDENGICMENCDGSGPNPIFADSDEADDMCCDCELDLL